MAYARNDKYTIFRNIETEVRAGELSDGTLSAEQRDLIDALMSYQKHQTYNMDDDCSDESNVASHYFVQSEVNGSTGWCFRSKEGVSPTTQEMLEQLEQLEEELWEQGTKMQCINPDGCEYNPNDGGPKSPG